ncbi:MAG: hypothetical protein ABJQ14_14090 [Hyphomicrobiales bacterium]
MIRFFYRALTGDSARDDTGWGVVLVVGAAKGVGVSEHIGEDVAGVEEPKQLHSTSIVMLESLEKVADEAPGIPPSWLLSTTSMAKIGRQTQFHS